MTARERYDELVDDLCARNDDVEPAQMMGMPCVKRGGKMVAGFTRGAMVFKLPDPDAHARALALEGAHLFDPSGKGRPFYYFAYGAAVTEVVIDRLTGENRVLRTDILHDTGTSLNPALDVGQVEGAYVQGVGWLTTEELVWDGKGRLATHAPSTYKIPACSDRPDVFNVALWGKPNREDAVGKSKAVGEPPFMLGISAFYALSDAVAACGDGSVYPALDAPATAERVLMAVRRVERRV